MTRYVLWKGEGTRNKGELLAKAVTDFNSWKVMRNVY